MGHHGRDGPNPTTTGDGGGLATVTIVFLALPVVALLAKASWGTLWADLTTPEARSALKLSLVCSLWATALSMVFGVPLAWVLARTEFPGRNLVRALVILPMVLPPVVGGVALLLAFGRRGLVGGWLYDWFGIQLTFSTAGVVLAETFVSMPFLIITVEAALRSMDRRYEEAAVDPRRRTLDRVPPDHPAADPAVAGRRRRADLGPRPRGVRRHHHLRRQHPGAHPDAAAGRLPAARGPRGRRHRAEPGPAGHLRGGAGVPAGPVARGRRAA